MRLRTRAAPNLVSGQGYNYLNGRRFANSDAFLPPYLYQLKTEFARGQRITVNWYLLERDRRCFQDIGNPNIEFAVTLLKVCCIQVDFFLAHDPSRTQLN